MQLIYHPVFLDHQTGQHPESPRRLEAFDKPPVTDPLDGTPYLELVHDSAYIEMVRRACQVSARLDPDTVTSPGSFEAAVSAVGATVLASVQKDFALVRPPGHHAYPDRATGFCLFNNVAIAAQKLAEEGQRVFIFDFDGHQGDGTAHIFYGTDRVMYCSMHQYPAFPGTGWVNEIGRNKGEGFTMNLPLPPGSGDDIFVRATEVCMAVLEQFQPDVVAVSAGFDAHRNDPLLQMEVTENGFYHVGKMLSEWSENIFAVLEGGYNVEALPRCVANFLGGVNGKRMPMDEFPATVSEKEVWNDFDERIKALEGYLKPYWKFS